MNENCEGCPFVEWKQCEIQKWENQMQSGIDNLAGTAGFINAPLGEIFPKLINSAADLDEVVAQYTDVGKVRIVEVLADRPELARAHFKHMDLLSKYIDRNNSAIEKAQSTCEGPKTKWVYRPSKLPVKATVCTGKGTWASQYAYLRHQAKP